MEKPEVQTQPQRQKPDAKDRVIAQLERQRNGALSQAALFGAELESVQEALAESEARNAALQAQLDALKPAEGATVAPPQVTEPPPPGIGTEG